MNYRYRIYPNTAQEQTLNEWMDICRGAYNYADRNLFNEIAVALTKASKHYTS